MKTLVASALAAIAFAQAGSAHAQVAVSAQISINQPGVYGVVNIGNAAPPAVALMQPRPILITPVAGVEPPPLYLYVPVGEQWNWRRNCVRYNACGRRVYFVREDWVRQRYEQAHPGWSRDHGYGRLHDDHVNHAHDRERGHDHDHGDGHDHGPGGDGH